MRAAQHLPVLRMWFIVAVALVALASGQRDENHEGKNGQGGPHGPPGGPPGGGSRRKGEGHTPPDEPAPVCTEAQTAAGIEAAQAYAECTGLEYADFMSLVHVDLEILQAAEVCFNEKLAEIEAEIPKDKELSEKESEELGEKIDKALSDCVEQAEAADETNAAGATIDFLNKILGLDSKICSCFPAFEDNMPECRSWARFHHFGKSVEALCGYVDSGATMIPNGGELNPPETQQGGGQTNFPSDSEIEDKASVPEEAPKEEHHESHVPNSYGPCAPGQPGQQHPNGANGCQPSLETEEDYPDEGGPPRDQGGGPLGFGMMVLGVIVVGASVGVGGVWAWGKFQGGLRQPGVRYMATGLQESDMGTELGPFGREYA